MSITRRALRRLLYDEIPVLGFSGTADSIAAGTITDTYMLEDSNLPSEHFLGTYIYRPDMSTDDLVKKAGTLVNTTGVLSHTGSNYSDTSDLDYEIVGLMHPDELNACITRALKKVFFETQVPLTIITDGDMDDSGVTNWTATNSTRTKSTTAAQVWSGIRSLAVTCTGANGYVATASYPVAPNTNLLVSAVCRPTIGDEAKLIIRDDTNGADIETVSTTETDWTRLSWSGAIPATCRAISVRLSGVGSNDIIYWNHLVVIPLDKFRFMAPTWLNEPHKFLKLRRASYDRNLADGVQMADSRRFHDWYQPQDFSLDAFHPDTNPYAIQLQKSHPTTDELWIEGKRPHYDLDTLSTEASTTSAPEKLIKAAVKNEVALLLYKRYPTMPEWQALVGETNLEYTSEVASRPEVPMMPRRIHTLGRI